MLVVVTVRANDIKLSISQHKIPLLLCIHTHYSGHKPVDVQEEENPSLVDSDEDKYKRKGTMERISRTLKYVSWNMYKVYLVFKCIVDNYN